MSNRKQPSSRGWIGSVLAAATIVAVALTVVFSGRLIADSYAYFSFEPGSTIESFVTRSGMSDRGRFYFYASRPSLETAENFNRMCGTSEDKTAILGCYTGQKIYIYDIRDDRLTGIRATTAAHEMLHAAYDRLNDEEKRDIDGLLEAEFEKLKTDKELSERMAFYARTEPGQRSNELHSLIGTEVESIDQELEAYYTRYFADRSKVVALHDQYESVFTSLRNQAEDLNRQIERQSEAIKTNTAIYNERTAALKNDIADFNARARRGDFGSQAEFDAERQNLMTRVSDLESLRTDINGIIDEYNRLVAELGGIATETEDLNRSIDSSLDPPPSL